MKEGDGGRPDKAAVIPLKLLDRVAQSVLKALYHEPFTRSDINVHAFLQAPKGIRTEMSRFVVPCLATDDTSLEFEMQPPVTNGPRSSFPISIKQK